MYFFGGKNRLKYTFFEVILLSFFKLNPRINTAHYEFDRNEMLLILWLLCYRARNRFSMKIPVGAAAERSTQRVQPPIGNWLLQTR